MTNRKVLITGADGGLGTHVTRAFLAAGARVVGISRNIKQEDFPSASFIALPAEVASAVGAQSAAENAVKQLGGLDVVVHTVGGFAGGQRVDQTDDATFQRMFNTNLNSAFYLLRAAIPHLRRSRSGRIIAIGSRAVVDPGPGIWAYSASKAALVSLIKTVALENKDVGLTANVILPGTIDTPANRKAMPDADTSPWVQPGNIASLAIWLAGDAGKDVNGAAIPLYGAGL